ncbi:MAG: hypothetical protein AB7O32_01390 [Vicinamibacterales bacterium]
MPTSRTLTRKEFLSVAAAALPGLLIARGASGQDVADAVRRERVADVFRMYHLLGSHRTATTPDHDTAEWLAKEVSTRGAELTPRSFELERVDLRAAFVEAPGGRREALPFFDGGFTTADGVRGRLGLPGSGAPILLVSLDQPAISSEGRSTAALRRDPSVKGIVAITEGGMPGLCPSNAVDFLKPYGCPVIQVSSSARDWLTGLAASGAEVRLVADAGRTRTTATNTIAAVRGRRPDLPPVVVMTPRSGWYQCVSERGGGLACWLEIMTAVAEARPERTVRFIASSGHELGHLGLDAVLHDEAALIKGAAAWLHLGANIGAANGRTRLQSSSDEIEALGMAAMEAAGARIDARVPRGTVPAGEARNIHVGGGRYISLLGSGPYFHNPLDLWPQSVDLDAVLRYAAATTQLTLTLARASA